jgi:hypothetical protein
LHAKPAAAEAVRMVRMVRMVRQRDADEMLCLAQRGAVPA